MRKLLLGIAAATLLFGASTTMAAEPTTVQLSDGVYRDAQQPALDSVALYVYGGRNYCWYDGGWRGRGYYWCGYAWRRGYGWGGGYGWRGWGGGGWRGGWHGGGWRGGRVGWRGGRGG